MHRSSLNVTTTFSMDDVASLVDPSQEFLFSVEFLASQVCTYFVGNGLQTLTKEGHQASHSPGAMKRLPRKKSEQVLEDEKDQKGYCQSHSWDGEVAWFWSTSCT